MQQVFLGQTTDKQAGMGSSDREGSLSFLLELSAGVGMGVGRGLALQETWNGKENRARDSSRWRWLLCSRMSMGTISSLIAVRMAIYQGMTVANRCIQRMLVRTRRCIQQGRKCGKGCGDHQG